jgi:hypothetical protein
MRCPLMEGGIVIDSRSCNLRVEWHVCLREPSLVGGDVGESFLSLKNLKVS